MIGFNLVAAMMIIGYSEMSFTRVGHAESLLENLKDGIQTSQARVCNY